MEAVFKYAVRMSAAALAGIYIGQGVYKKDRNSVGIGAVLFYISQLLIAVY